MRTKYGNSPYLDEDQQKEEAKSVRGCFTLILAVIVLLMVVALIVENVL